MVPAPDLATSERLTLKAAALGSTFQDTSGTWSPPRKCPRKRGSASAMIRRLPSSISRRLRPPEIEEHLVSLIGLFIPMNDGAKSLQHCLREG